MNPRDEDEDSLVERALAERVLTHLDQCELARVALTIHRAACAQCAHTVEEVPPADYARARAAIHAVRTWQRD